MLIEEDDSKKIFKKSILAYLLISYVISIIVSMVLMGLYQSFHNVDIDVFNKILESQNYSYYLEIEFETTVHVLNFFSLYNLSVYVLSFGTLCYFLKTEFVKNFDIFKKENIKKTLITLVIVTVIFFILYLLVNSITNSLIENLGISQAENQEFVVLLLQYAALPMFITTVFLGPIVEELVFRKCIFGLIDNKYVALAVSSLTFASIHLLSSLGLGYNFLELLAISLPYLTGGILFGLIYIKTKNIYYSIIVHILINLFSVVIVFIT